MICYRISVHLSGKKFDPALLLSRLTLAGSAHYKNKPSDLRPFGNDQERGKVPYGYGSLTLLDSDVLGRVATTEDDLLQFLHVLSTFFDFLEDYAVEDARLALSLAYGQQGVIRLSPPLMLAIAGLGQGLTLTVYQDQQMASTEQESNPSLSVIAKELQVDEVTFIHLIKPHIINVELYKEE